MEIKEFQDLLRKIYYPRDKRRGVSRTFVWFVEEIGELAKLLREGKKGKYQEEIGDVLAWLVSLANLVGVDMERAARKYEQGCPKCGRIPCECKYDKPSFKI